MVKNVLSYQEKDTQSQTVRGAKSVTSHTSANSVIDKFSV